MAQELSCSSAWMIFPGQESSLYLLHWQVDSLPLRQVKPSDKYLQQLIKTGNLSPWYEVRATSFSTLPHMCNPKQHLVWVDVFFPFPFFLFLSSPLPLQFSSVTQSYLTLWDPMNHSTPGLPVHHQLPEFTQTHAHQIGDAIQPSHPLSAPSPPAPNPSQHQGLFQWVNSSHQVAKV